MTAADVAALLMPVTAEAPSGPAIEYDDRFLELERLARGTAQEEDANGKVVREAREPDWPEVERIALDLASKSKDLRVAIYLARAKLARDGLAGFKDSLEVIQGYVREFWPSVHPELDPNDNNDPSSRLNTLAALNHNETVLRALRLAPLTQSRQFGRLSYRDFAIAGGLLPPPKDSGEKIPDASRIEAAFADTAIETLTSTQSAVGRSLECLADIDAALGQAVGAGGALDFTPLQKQLGEIKGLLDQEVVKRGGGGAPVANGGDGVATGPTVGVTSGVLAAATGGPVRSRDDVLLLLDKICRYYADYEPSSPVPLILSRTKRLVTMNFLDILKDLTPGGVQEFGVIAGIKGEGEG